MNVGEQPAAGRPLRFLVTGRCNLRCGFCHNEFQGGPADRRPYWDDGAVRGLLAAERRCPARVKFSGGEPLLYWPELLQLLGLTRQAGVNDITVFTNLTLFGEARARRLRRLGVGRLTVNLPSFDPATYAERTARARWPLSSVVRHAMVAREQGMLVQLNMVLPVLSAERDVRRLVESELAAADRYGAAWDKLAFLADDWGQEPERVRAWTRDALTASGARPLVTHPTRSWEFAWRRKSLLATRCTSWSSARERDDADLYVVPPGRPLRRFTRGRAYR